MLVGRFTDGMDAAGSKKQVDNTMKAWYDCIDEESKSDYRRGGRNNVNSTGKNQGKQQMECKDL